MEFYKEELEVIANAYLDQNSTAKGSENKPNYSNRDFMNAVIIFQNAIMDKLWDYHKGKGTPYFEVESAAIDCGLDLHLLIKQYTGLDTHKVEDFVR